MHVAYYVERQRGAQLKKKQFDLHPASHTVLDSGYAMAMICDLALPD